MFFYRIIVIGLAALLAACSGNGIKTGKSDISNLSKEEAVAQRVKERWQYVIDKDLQASYEYLTPGSKVAMPFESYAMRMVQAQIRWLSVDDVKVVCEDEETCKVDVALEIEVNVPGARKVVTPTIQQEDWLKDGTNWYYLPGQIQ